MSSFSAFCCTGYEWTIVMPASGWLAPPAVSMLCSSKAFVATMFFVVENECNCYCDLELQHG